MQPLSPADPDRIGPFRVLAELGRGAMGRVLLGAGADGRLVAVKTIREWLLGDEEFRARFREEVRKSRQVSGAYTAAVVDAGPDAPVPWLASEFLRGPTLEVAVRDAGPLPEAAVVRLAAGLAAALASVHAAGVIHRDLKPGNVILEASGPRVIDFGIARAAEGSDLTRTGALIGTPGFMSPEQTRSLPLTAASDVFSLGSVLVLAATGTGPFAGASTLDTMNNVVRAEPDLSGVPERVRAIAERCLALEPADRPTPAALSALIGPVPPTSRPWPDAVAALASAQEREIAHHLGDLGEAPTRIDFGPTMVTDPNRPTWVREAKAGTAEPPHSGPPPSSPPHVSALHSSPPLATPRHSTAPHITAPHVTAPPPTPPPVPPAAAGATPARLGAGAAALLVCAAVAGIAWYVNREDDTDGLLDQRDRYVEQCRDDGYGEDECEESWPNDPSSTWTGTLYSEDADGFEPEWTEEETTDDDQPTSYDVYVEDCQDDGHTRSECETSWINDSSYTWTGELFDSEPSEKEVYIEECTADGYSTEDCESSWYSDPSYTWTGEIF
ncbi:hypothetical protein GCM10009853_033040 [Glycomyces scopariae]